MLNWANPWIISESSPYTFYFRQERPAAKTTGHKTNEKEQE
jgi:hypothetical protein